MTKCYFVRLGTGGSFAAEALEGGFMGVDYSMVDDFTGKFSAGWTEFNRANIPRFLELNPGKTKIAAGLACGSLWVIGKGIAEGDVVVSPTPSGDLRVGHVVGDYWFAPEGPLPHRRKVRWEPAPVAKADLSPDLQRSITYPGTVAEISQHLEEILRLFEPAADVVPTNPEIEDVSEFVLEKYLEEFLMENWKRTDLGKAYDIYPDEDGNLIGRQYLTDTGPLDILAISKDKSHLLVVELKRGKASDSVVGQVQRYMGFVKDQLAEPGQDVHGVIIALEDDLRIRRALSVAANIDFYRYKVSFSLSKA